MSYGASFQGFFFQLWPENAAKSYGFGLRLVGSNNGRRRAWNSKTQIQFPQQRGSCLIAGLRNSVACGNSTQWQQYRWISSVIMWELLSCIHGYLLGGDRHLGPGVVLRSNQNWVKHFQTCNDWKIETEPQAVHVYCIVYTLYFIYIYI